MEEAGLPLKYKIAIKLAVKIDGIRNYFRTNDFSTNPVSRLREYKRLDREYKRVLKLTDSERRLGVDFGYYQMAIGEITTDALAGCCLITGFSSDLQLPLKIAYAAGVTGIAHLVSTYKFNRDRRIFEKEIENMHLNPSTPVGK